MNADTHNLLRRLVENAKEEHQLETDLSNLLLDSDDAQIEEINFICSTCCTRSSREHRAGSGRSLHRTPHPPWSVTG